MLKGPFRLAYFKKKKNTGIVEKVRILNHKGGGCNLKKTPSILTFPTQFPKQTNDIKLYSLPAQG